MRFTHIDTMKGILVLEMIYSHAYFFFAAGDPLFGWISAVITIGAFSGFLFCFGYAAYHAYLSKPMLPVTRMVRNSIRILLAFYCSGILYNFIVDANFTLRSVIDVVLLNDLPPFSEFLLSFFLIILLAIIFHTWILRLLNNTPLLFTLIIACFAFSLVDTSGVTSTRLGLFIGMGMPRAFPVIHYAPFFLLGAWYALHAKKSSMCIGMFALTPAVLMAAMYIAGSYDPIRYPPSLVWLLCSLGLVYAHDAFAYRIDALPRIAEPLRMIGRNALYYLLISNILIFAIATHIGKETLTVPRLLLITFAVIVTSVFLDTLRQRTNVSVESNPV